MTDWRQMRDIAQKRDGFKIPTVLPKVPPDHCAHCQSPHWYLKWTENGWYCDVCSKLSKE